MTSSAIPGNPQHIIVVGGGFSGLSAALELARAGIKVTVLEQDEEFGGLAGSFSVGEVKLEKFYHHWFKSDVHILELAKDIGCEEEITWHRSLTGMYFAHQFFKLGTPLDLLRFNALPLIDRIRLGLLTLRVQHIKNWRRLESFSAREWLIKLGGRKVFEVVWEPLLRGKFGSHWSDISAVWIWNKLKLRGGSRSGDGAEVLGYYKGGFAALAASLVDTLKEHGVTLHTGTPVRGLAYKDARVSGVVTDDDVIYADATLVTTAPALLADIIERGTPAPLPISDYLSQLRQIDYLGNICLVLELDRPLSELYWLNVNDPTFPFVAIIEHTNFEPSETYSNRHIVYLSKYLAEDDPLFSMTAAELFAFSLPHIQRMFPEFSEEWVLGHNLWKARYAQPIVVKNYTSKIPAFESPIPDLYLCNMAQVYPEDRGTNYAVREGRNAGRNLASKLLHAAPE